jgi:2-amino-4-hydroxy-6-hydroxymethyldihydropteridine diphosphokinase
VTEAVIALGSNRGARAGNLQAAIDLMPEFGVRPVRVSGAWETPPVPADQPAFLNAVLVAETGLTAEAGATLGATPDRPRHPVLR